MGGNAVKLLGFTPRRIQGSEIPPLARLVREELGHDFNWLELVKSVGNKTEHGDLDFVGFLKEGRGGWVDTLRRAGWSVYWNAPVASVFFKGVQIDLAGLQDERAAQARLDFCHFSPVGNVVGKMIKQTGAKWGVDGLSYPVKSEIGGTGDTLGFIHLSTSIHDIFAVAGVDFRQWAEGFSTREELYAWASRSRLFNKAIFHFDNLNSAARKRDRLRRDYHDWLEYTQSCADHAVWAEPQSEEGKKYRVDWFAEFCQMFPSLEAQREGVLLDWERARGMGSKFNGHLVSEWTGLKGPELGACMAEFKKSFGGVEEFRRWMENTTESEIKDVFLKYHLRQGGGG